MSRRCNNNPRFACVWCVYIHRERWKTLNQRHWHHTKTVLSLLQKFLIHLLVLGWSDNVRNTIKSILYTRIKTHHKGDHQQIYQERVDGARIYCSAGVYIHIRTSAALMTRGYCISTSLLRSIYSFIYFFLLPFFHSNMNINSLLNKEVPTCTLITHVPEGWISLWLVARMYVTFRLNSHLTFALISAAAAAAKVAVRCLYDAMDSNGLGALGTEYQAES